MRIYISFDNNRKSLLKAGLCLVAAACLLAGCANLGGSGGNSSSRGTITMTLPDSPQNAGVSRNITADGENLPTPDAEAVDADEGSITINKVLKYTVRLYDSKYEVPQKKERIPPRTDDYN